MQRCILDTHVSTVTLWSPTLIGGEPINVTWSIPDSGLATEYILNEKKHNNTLPDRGI